MSRNNVYYNDHGAPPPKEDQDIPLAYGTPMAIPPPLAPNNNNNNHNTAPLTSSARSVLQEQGYTQGLQEALQTNKVAFRLAYWIVDNSGSMATLDGHRILQVKNKKKLSFAPCTRWREMQETVEYHSQMAALLQSPTVFRLLNPPGAAAGPQRFSVAERGDSIDTDVALAQQVMLNTQPGGVTPLTQHVQQVHAEIASLQHTTLAGGARVAVVLATDGVPTDARGYSDSFVKQQFVDALRGLMSLPVWVVVRLCTDEESVVTYWNTLDENTELSLEILDDFVAEAEEVHQCNRWLNYGLPLHRMRELGFHHRTFDLLDERRLSKGELRDFCRLLLGHNEVIEAPDPDADWKGFCDTVSRLLAKEQKQWNPVTKRMEPWIDMKKLNRDFGHGGFFGLF